MKNLGVFVSLLVLSLMLVAAFASRGVASLPPALQSWWLPVHASIALFADGFALACIGGIMYLLQEREIKNKRFGLFYSRLPSLEALDKLNHHCLSVGFPLLTLGLITGSFWAKQAWGAYWHWDPKETWSLVTWFCTPPQCISGSPLAGAGGGWPSSASWPSSGAVYPLGCFQVLN